MAVVYKAWQPDLERYVALKVLNNQELSREKGFIERFLEEGKIIARLKHLTILILAPRDRL